MKKVIYFMALLVCSGLLAQQHPDGPPPSEHSPMNGPKNPETHLKQLKKDLQLTEVQELKIREYFKSRKEILDQKRPKNGQRPSREEMEAHHEANRKAEEVAFQKILTPEQFKTWKAHLPEGRTKGKRDKNVKKQKK